MDRYRLPQTVAPSRYELRLEPDLAGATFDGEVTITIAVAEPVTEILLNAIELQLNEAWLESDIGMSLQATVTLDEAIKLMGLKYTPGPQNDVPLIEHGAARTMRVRAAQRKILAATPAWVQKGGDPKQLDVLVREFQQAMEGAIKDWEIYYKRSSDRGDNWEPTVRLTNSPGGSLPGRPEMLKSSSSGWPSALSRMLDGLTSRCNTPRSWACCNASASRATTQATQRK